MIQVTGQAFEDMQEQNARLIQQLREKVGWYIFTLLKLFSTHNVYVV